MLEDNENIQHISPLRGRRESLAEGPNQDQLSISYARMNTYTLRGRRVERRRGRSRQKYPLEMTAKEETEIGGSGKQ